MLLKAFRSATARDQSKSQQALCGLSKAFANLNYETNLSSSPQHPKRAQCRLDISDSRCGWNQQNLFEWLHAAAGRPIWPSGQRTFQSGAWRRAFGFLGICQKSKPAHFKTKKAKSRDHWHRANKKSVDYKKVKIKSPTLIVLGNEVEGISKSLLKKCDVIAEIPMRGKKESLNVAVSFGIAIFRMLNI
jgi:hypothetical protein